MSQDFPEGVGRRERLLEWMRDGDPSRVPVMIGPGFYVASSHYGVPMREVTWELAARAAAETQTDNVQCISSPLPFDAIDFTDELSLDTAEETLAGGMRRSTRVLSTPRGQLRDVRELDDKHGNVHREFFVKGPEDFPAFESYIRTAGKTILEKPEVRRRVTQRMRDAEREGGGRFPTEIHVFCPTVELMSSYYMDQATAIYTLYDNRDVMEELFDLHWQTTQIWLECAADVDVDIYNYAINGLEWLSVDIYERYMIPQARRINQWADAHGKLSWIHTCGKKKGLIERDVYRRMGVKVVESLSAPPTGDLDDYAWARSRLGSHVTTRGGVNCELFYAEDPGALKARAHEVLDGCRGYRHMIGDTNGSTPPYKWAMIQALIDVVHERGLAF